MKILFVVLCITLYHFCSGFPVEGEISEGTLVENGTSIKHVLNMIHVIAKQYWHTSNITASNDSLLLQQGFGKKVVGKIKGGIKTVKDKISVGWKNVKDKISVGWKNVKDKAKNIGVGTGGSGNDYNYRKPYIRPNYRGGGGGSLGPTGTWILVGFAVLVGVTVLAVIIFYQIRK
ncbi:hypothetical protein CEXT_172511 [Caerostris extrusa]|uniref:Uncharacterized protein n=1 Tax=Caerostris extrusa TaxID=172846 RepID=A0AAV4VIQ8_CAEEX|nr:hypothetical protein CEXT_172511 [Caerostris extrusa]